ncbi:hypothetical protein QQ054_32075 [Oscillatoria amoena NRMC-F 0135]|nr:hypothetical protein [Oscillatoria amoena NRMC-F 0135]
MIGNTLYNPVGVYYPDGLVAHSDYFKQSVSQDRLLRQYIAQHPASVDASNLTKWFDISPNKSHASIFNSPTWDGKSFAFNGINQVATYSWPFDTTSNDSLFFTIEMWLRPSSATDIYVNSSSSPGGYIRMLYTASGRYILFFVRTASGNMTYSTNFVPFTVGELEHVVCVRDYDRLYIYRNGILIPPNQRAVFLQTL